MHKIRGEMILKSRKKRVTCLMITIAGCLVAIFCLANLPIFTNYDVWKSPYFEHMLRFNKQTQTSKEWNTYGTLNRNDEKNYFRETYVAGTQTVNEEILARRLAKQVRILCWVMTQKENHKTKAVHVRATWGRHCNTLLFMSDDRDETLPIIPTTGKPGREHLWAKTVEAFKFVHKNHSADYDWVLKADDDTYVIVENLRKMLLPYSPQEPIYFGFHYGTFIRQGYMSGGAGYVLSAESVDRLVSNAFRQKHDKCPNTTNNHAEDVNMGRCLQAVGVQPGDSRDANGKHRFLPFDISTHVSPGNFNSDLPPNHWIWTYTFWPLRMGTGCCSDDVITFHYIKPHDMYVIEYLAYRVRPFPVLHHQLATPPIQTNRETLQTKSEE